MIHKLKIEIETDNNITYEDTLRSFETHFICAGELFDINGSDGCIVGIDIYEEKNDT
jgi:hypothetical protein